VASRQEAIGRRPAVPCVKATRLVDEARIATLDVLGDGAAASAIAARWFRADG